MTQYYDVLSTGVNGPVANTQWTAGIGGTACIPGVSNPVTGISGAGDVAVTGFTVSSATQVFDGTSLITLSMPSSLVAHGLPMPTPIGPDSPGSPTLILDSATIYQWVANGDVYESMSSFWVVQSSSSALSWEYTACDSYINGAYVGNAFQYTFSQTAPDELLLDENSQGYPRGEPPFGVWLSPSSAYFSDSITIATSGALVGQFLFGLFQVPNAFYLANGLQNTDIAQQWIVDDDGFAIPFSFSTLFYAQVDGSAVSIGGSYANLGLAGVPISGMFDGSNYWISTYDAGVPLLYKSNSASLNDGFELVVLISTDPALDFVNSGQALVSAMVYNGAPYFQLFSLASSSVFGAIALPFTINKQPYPRPPILPSSCVPLCGED